MCLDVRPESMERITTPELAEKFIEEQIDLVRKQRSEERRVGKEC